MMLRYRATVGVLERAVAVGLLAAALATGGCDSGDPVDKDMVKKERVEPPPPAKRKREKVVLEPLASPDCAAPLPELTAAPSKVQEADGLRAPATAGPAMLVAGPILGDITDQSVTVWINADRAVPWQVS